MTVYIDRPVRPGEVERAECELVAVCEDGAAILRGDRWDMAYYPGPVMDADGTPLATDELRAMIAPTEKARMDSFEQQIALLLSGEAE